MKLFKEEEQNRAAIFTAFLTVKGKVMFDAIIVKPKLAQQNEESGEIEYWIDVHEKDAEQLIDHLKKYSLRQRNLQINDISHIIKVFQIQTPNGIVDKLEGEENEENYVKEGHFYNLLQDSVEMQESQEFPGELETDVAAFIDPRTNYLGVRILCHEQSLEIEGDDIKKLDQSDEYRLVKNSLGIPESSSELGDQFPLNMNLHYLNGVSFSKGCYIGQELTQRTFHTGVVRRIALPFIILSKLDKQDQKFRLDASNFSPLNFIDKDFDIDVKGEEIFGKYKEKIQSDIDDKEIKEQIVDMKLGKILGHQYNCGIALVDVNKLDMIGQNKQYNMSDYRVVIWQPTWLDAARHHLSKDSNLEEDSQKE